MKFWATSLDPALINSTLPPSFCSQSEWWEPQGEEQGPSEEPGADDKPRDRCLRARYRPQANGNHTDLVSLTTLYLSPGDHCPKDLPSPGTRHRTWS